MNPQLQQQLIARLDALGAKLGSAAQDVWAIYTRQMYVSAIEDVFLLLSVVALILAFRWVRKNAHAAWKQDRYNKDRPYSFSCDENVWEVISTFGGIVASIYSMIVVFASIGDLITIFVNPRYWVLSNIVSSLTSK